MSSVQFNLLPDIKIQHLKTERTRKTVLAVCILVSAAAFAIFLLMLLTVHVIQKKQLSDANKDIATYSTKLKNVDNLDKILTVRNQLTSLVALHQSKHVVSRLFAYLPEITPTNVNVGRLTADFVANTFVIDGTADSQHSVNVFIDTLKFTTFTTSANTAPRSAFPSVIESSFGASGGNLGYTLNVTFDPVLFSNNTVDNQGHAAQINLKVPNLTSTRSVLNDPSNVLFNGVLNTQQKTTGGQ